MGMVTLPCRRGVRECMVPESIRTLPLVTAMLFLSAEASVAQEVSIVAELARTSFDAIERSAGIGAAVRVPVRGRISARASVDWLGGSEDGTGFVCGSLDLMINPASCREEPLERSNRVRAVSAGANVNLIARQRLRVSILPEVLLATVNSRIRGALTRNRLDSGKGHFGYGSSLEMTVYPSRRVPASVVLGMRLARLSPIGGIDVVDGYAPFSRPFTLRTVFVGSSWTWRN